MLTPKLILCADTIIIDSATKHVSIINLFEELTFPTLPAMLPRFCILSTFEREEADPENYDVNLNISIDSQVIIDNQPFKINFQGQLRTRNIYIFAGMPIQQPGNFLVKILRDDKLLQECLIRVLMPKPSIKLEQQA